MNTYLTIIVRHLQTGFLLSGIILFSGCEKVIDVDLNSVSPEIVIEGSVTDQAGPYSVTLSKTVNFDEPNVFPPVSGAVVTISDNLGNTDVLSEGPSGTYKTTTLTGVPGRNYFLKVETGGKEYQATSSLASPVAIDTVLVDSISFGPNSNKFLQVKFTDPAGIDNYYRIVEIINGDTLSIINLSSDEFEDGDQITVPVFSDEDPKLESGDTVEVLLLSIDKNVFDYFLELISVINGGGSSAAPANPTSNISNNALGYFSAHSMTTQTIVVP